MKIHVWVSKLEPFFSVSTAERKSAPKVGYVTAYDFYITTCFTFCFAALIEFAIVKNVSGYLNHTFRSKVI